MTRTGMVAVRVGDHGVFDGAPGIYVEVSGLAVEAMFSEPDHVGFVR